MKDNIKNNLNHPEQLEQLYRSNKALFKKSFDEIYPDIEQNPVARYWYERLHYKNADISRGAKNEPAVVIGIALLAGLVAKLPDFLHIDNEAYFTRNVAFVVFPMLAIFFAWKQRLQIKKWLIISFCILASVVYINLLPEGQNSDTFILACIHLPLFLWAVLGFAFTGKEWNNFEKRNSFLRYNGDLLVMTTVILIAGGILSAVTVGLFDLIHIPITEFYFKNIAIWGLAAAPVVGTYLVRSNPQLVRNVSPVIAKVFTPLVLVMLLVYLAAMVYTGKDPYNDREFLLLFNLLLIGVMAIILFSVSEISGAASGKISRLLLLMLAVVTVIINCIALSAILFRISEWGITPNRLAILGSNILILINLIMVTFRLFQATKRVEETVKVEYNIAAYLPVYTLWTLLVTFLFPLLFQFK